MLTPHKLQTNMVEMEEEARTFISRQPIMEEKVEKVVVEAELNYPINLTMIDKLQWVGKEKMPENLQLNWIILKLIITKEVVVITV